MSDTNTQRLRWLEGQRMLRVRGRDFLIFLFLVALAGASVVTGAFASRQVTPASAKQISAMLRRLEPVTVLPNVVLMDEDGSWSPLLTRTKREEAVVVFYGAACESCRDTLPRMVKAFGTRGPLLVVIKQTEDAKEARRSLDDMGLTRLGFAVDGKGLLESGGMVDVLPTIFRIAGNGRVLERIEAANDRVFERLLRRFGGSSYRRVSSGRGAVSWEQQ